MFLYSKWCSLPLQVRQKIAEIFGIEKKGQTQVDSNVIIHDGYYVEDIEAKLTPDTIRDYLRTSEQEVQILWQRLINKIEGKEEEPVGEIVPPNHKNMPGSLPKEEAEQFKKEFEARKKAAKKTTPKTKLPVKKVTVKKNAKTTKSRSK